MTLPTLDPTRWKALALLCAAQFIVILDTSIIGVALPTIQSDLGFSDEEGLAETVDPIRTGTHANDMV